MSARLLQAPREPARKLGPAVGRGVLVASKRALDVLVSATLLLALLPLLAAIALLVRLDSPGPAFFRCERVGHRGRRLRMLKFRKMHDGAAGSPLTDAEDERFTRIGRVLAKYKLDELPQLWHVLLGEMSLVGPRPESPTFVERFPDAFHDGILTVKPGMVGLCQLAFADETHVLDPTGPIDHYVDVLLPQKIALDRLYAARANVVTDVRILFWTFVAVVLRQPVAVHRTSTAMNLRRR